MLGQNVATFARPPAGGGSGGMGPSLDLNFVSSTVLDSRLTFTRAGASNTATRFDTFGNMQGTNTNVPRFDYGPSGGTTPIGLLLEETRTNSIRNPRAEGASAGTPGTAPTNWGYGTVTGLTRTINGVGTENGIPYIEIRINGTATASGTALYLPPETNTAIVAAAAQIWTYSCYVRLVAGSTANVNTFAVNLQPYDSTPATVGPTLGQTAFTPTGAALVTQRVIGSPSTMPASTASVLPQLVASVTSGAVVDFTVRVGGPQVELGAFATSLILPVAGTPAVTTRSGEAVSMPVGSWYNPVGGTFAGDFLTNQAAGSGTQEGIMRLDDTTANNVITMYINLSGQIAGTGNSGGVAEFNNFLNPGGAVLTFPALGKCAITYGATWHSAYNGANGQSGGGTLAPVSPTRLIVGGSNISLTSWPTNGWMKRLRYWNRILTDVELRQVTT